MYLFYMLVLLSPFFVAGIPIRRVSDQERWIIVLKRDISPSSIDQHYLWLKKYHSTTHTIHQKWAHASLFGYSITAHSDTVQKIQSHHAVEYIQKENYFKASALGVQQHATWGLSRISHHSKVSPKEDSFVYPSLGENVAVYILDSGIDITHPEFQGRARWGFSSFSNTPQDHFGHGTHVAGIVASKTFGVAKQAWVVAVQVLDAHGEGSTSDIIRGVHYVMDQVRKNPSQKAIINMSFGGPADDVLDDVLESAVQMGIPVVVAAGNEGQDACQYSPGRKSFVITVGASDDLDQFAAFSNSGACVDIVAPGKDIQSLWPGGLTKSLDGTSSAAPHVSGVIASLWSQYPNASPSHFLSQAATLNVLQVPKETVNRLLYNRI